MSFSLLRDVVHYMEAFSKEVHGEVSVQQFAAWLYGKVGTDKSQAVSDWEGKSSGRSVESVINTSLIHLFRYAKLYSKLAINDSPFTTIDEVIFLLNLKHLGKMSKTALIELNIHEKSTGIQIINRLLEKGFIAEDINEYDKRSRKIEITSAGMDALGNNMEKVRKASAAVVANLTEPEKLELVTLLQKLEIFHRKRYKEGFQL